MLEGMKGMEGLEGLEVTPLHQCLACDETAVWARQDI